MKIANSVNHVSIRLTTERWQHISKNHKEVANLEPQIFETVSNPNFIVAGRNKELLAVKKLLDIYLVVVYKEERTDGFVITAFLARRIEQIKKKGIIWSQK